MRRLPQTPVRMVSGLLALVLASAVALLASAQPAAAHGTLAMSTPAADATVSEPMTSVQLFFTEKAAANAYFTVTAPGGSRVDNGWTYGEPKPLDKPVREYFLVDGKFEPREYTTGFPAVVALAHLPATGQYSVSYLSISSDGDTVRGTMTFRYSGRATAAPRGWSPPTNQPDPTLLAATEQHKTSGQSSAVPTTPAEATTAPAAAPPVASTDEDGPGAMAWTGWAVAAVAALAAFIGWRRRPAPVGRSSGRARTSTSASKRRSPDNRPAPGKTGTTKGVSADRGAGAPAGGGKRRPNAVPAGRKGDAVVNARTAVAVEATPTDREVHASAGPSGESRPILGSDLDAGAEVQGSRLSNTHLAMLVGGLVLALLAGFGLARIGTDTESPAGTARQPAAGALSAGQGESAGDGHQHAPGIGPHTHPGDGGGQIIVSGTTVSSAGYTLQPLERSQPASARTDYRFRIVGTDRQPATRFAVVHDKPLHMIVVGRDLSGYQHLHPTMAPDGTWSVPLTLTRPGGYRIYTDFSVTAANDTQVPLVLGVDHTVPGAHTPTALPAAQTQAVAGPYAVSMNGTPTVGATAPMQFQINRVDTSAPAKLERYLGAYGHLVVVREGDLGYVHVHPEQELVDGAVKFWLTAPSAGRYRAFFDFQVDGKVHNAEYTINLP
ncbi:copper resistance protein CopC [Micromonospora sp. WMMD1155]|uniref:copper resistance CopC family protein n=1 Tax=Micromonospora sp. WMMD1155 TaxID=3016094 RepID=UPI00249B47C5|nr:copper resistance protein CopC [Micromonospora sp. WMMD1155]WFE53063.1 copper resistance protein CopC [Micromonospora sp. WMMD1155]